MIAGRSARLACHVSLLLCLPACDAHHLIGEGLGTTNDNACPAFVAGPNLRVCTAGYVGESTAENAAAPQTAVADDGVVIVAAVLDSDVPGAPAQDVLGGGAGALLRLGAGGQRLLSATRVGKSIADLDRDLSDGALAVLAPPVGLVVFEADARTVRFHVDGAFERVASAGGTTAVLAAQKVTVFDRKGAARPAFATPAGTASDLTIDPASETVVVTGSSSTPGTFDVPWLVGYGFDGQMKWKAYGWSTDQAREASLGATTQGVRVAMGRDGKLYYLGRSVGGNTVHLRDPAHLDANTPAVQSDEFTRTYNASNNAITFVGRFAAATGVIEKSLFLVARDPHTGQVADTTPTTIATDQRGQVVVGGRMQCCSSNQSSRAISGAAVTPTAGGDGFVAVFAADFSSRPVWATWASGGSSTTTSVAVGAGRVAMAAVQTPDERKAGALLTHQPLVSTTASSTGTQTFLSVFAAP